MINRFWQWLTHKHKWEVVRATPLKRYAYGPGSPLLSASMLVWLRCRDCGKTKHTELENACDWTERALKKWFE